MRFSPASKHVVRNHALGIEITLDPDEVFIDDPGQGTPAIVRNLRSGESGTFFCVLDNGRFMDGEELCPSQKKCLEDKVDDVLEWWNAVIKIKSTK